MGDERRHAKRMELKSKLMIKRLDSEKPEEIFIDILDVSRGGVGFSATSPLEIGAIYESYLTIWTKEVLHAFLQIVRIELKGDEYHYGSVFVGLPEMEASRIDTYQTMTENEDEVRKN